MHEESNQEMIELMRKNIEEDRLRSKCIPKFQEDDEIKKSFLKKRFFKIGFLVILIIIILIIVLFLI